MPKPRVSLTRFHGVFAPNSKYRLTVTPAKRGKGKQRGDLKEDKTPDERRTAMTWAHQALDNNPGVEGRIVSFHGNTSDLTAAELDGSEELITEEPAAFALAYKELLNDHDIKIIGGCCGSNPDHIRAIADIL